MIMRDLIIISKIYLYIFNDILIENVIFSKSLLQTTFGLVHLKLISHLLLAIDRVKTIQVALKKFIIKD